MIVKSQQNIIELVTRPELQLKLPQRHSRKWRLYKIQKTKETEVKLIKINVKMSKKIINQGQAQRVKVDKTKT